MSFEEWEAGVEGRVSRLVLAFSGLGAPWERDGATEEAITDVGVEEGGDDSDGGEDDSSSEEKE